MVIFHLDTMASLPAGKEVHELSENTKAKSKIIWGRTRYDRYLLPCVAEFFGTALFVFSGCASVIENSPGTGRLQPAVAHGLALSISIAITAGIRCVEMEDFLVLYSRLEILWEQGFCLCAYYVCLSFKSFLVVDSFDCCSCSDANLN